MNKKKDGVKINGDAIHPDKREFKKSVSHVPCHLGCEVLSRGELLPAGLATGQRIPGFKMKEVFLE